eukprot:symbB.v1.2.033602.t1/scaffold4196.1/size83517/10
MAAPCSATSPRMPSGGPGSPRIHPIVAPPMAPVVGPGKAPGGSGSFPSSRPGPPIACDRKASLGSFAPPMAAPTAMQAPYHPNQAASPRTSGVSNYDAQTVQFNGRGSDVKQRWESTGVRHVGASLSTEAASFHTREASAASGSTQLQLAPGGGSIAASAGDAQVGALRSEIEGLRAELDALKTLLDEGKTICCNQWSQATFFVAMARIARRSLRIHGLPLFSLGHPWSSVVNAEGKLALSLFEPRFVEIVGKLLPPSGDARFGYAESYPPRERTAGVLVNIEDHRWINEGHEEFVAGYGSDPQVQVLANANGRFRILKARREQRDGIDLYYANVQLLSERDLQRGPGAEAMSYWSEEVSEGSPERASQVKAGTHLLAMVAAPVFESPESWRVIGQVPEGIRVIAMDVPRVVEGYLMVPIVPSGAVELTLFREPSGPMPEAERKGVQLPDAETLKAAIDGFQRPAAAWRRLCRRARSKARVDLGVAFLVAS